MNRLEGQRTERSAVSELVVKLGEDQPKRSEILLYRPEVYLNPGNETHGLVHAMNSVVVGDTLFSLARNEMIQRHGTEGIYTKRNRHIVKKALSIHDSHHSGEKVDNTHGELAANWTEKNLDDPDKEIIADIIRHHVRPDTVPMSQLAEIVKEADKAERVRADIDSDWYLDMSRLRLPHLTIPILDSLKEVNRLEKHLLDNNYSGDGVDVAMAAFILTGWMKMS